MLEVEEMVRACLKDDIKGSADPGVGGDMGLYTAPNGVWAIDTLLPCFWGDEPVPIPNP